MDEAEWDHAEWNQSRWLQRFRRRLVRWYDSQGRDLPWRRTRSPYEIWISEIMLQQTTVAAVRPFYERFLERFDSVEALASADEQEVLKYWEGLGYYSRARNLHRASRMIVDQFAGQLPPDVSALRSLPGVGPYSAGAIASFAFDLRAPIVEANTRRLYARLMGLQQDLRTAAAQRQLWTFAEHILPRQQVGRFNQALMDLGNTVCRPAKPDCKACPVSACCRAFAEGLQDVVPVVPERPPMTPLLEAALVVRSGQRVLLRECGPHERWAGLWDFPRVSLTEAFPDLVQQTISGRDWPRIRSFLSDAVSAQFDLQADVHDLVAEWKHTVTRYRIRLLSFEAELVLSGSEQHPEATSNAEWVTLRCLADRPLSTTGRRLADLVTASSGVPNQQLNT